MLLRQYKKRFLTYINKEDFNKAEQIDPVDYHSVFFTWATLFGVMDYEKMSLWMYLSPIWAAINASMAAIICFISCVHYVQLYNIHLITETGTYLIMMLYELIITISVVQGKKHYHKLIQAIKDDFHYINTVGHKYRERFVENQRLTFKACILMVVLPFITGVGMVVCACIAVLVTMHGQTDNAKRPLPFPFWLFDYELQASPVYETIFVFSILFTISFSYIYSFMMQSYVLWIREITCKADIIIWNLQDLLVDVFPAKTTDESIYYAQIIKHRMRGIIAMHQSMFRLTKDFASVYKKCLFFEQMIAAPVICMTAYCFAEKYEAGEVQFILLFLCVGSVVEVFLPNYLCTHLLEKIQSVSDACWDTPFWNAGPEIRPYLILIIQRSMRPLPIVAPGFADISLQTYSTSMIRAYSWFNMLRQADFSISK